MDQMGLLQLSTLESNVCHMGNMLDENVLSEVKHDSLSELISQNPDLKSSSKYSQISINKRRAFGCLNFLTRHPFHEKYIVTHL